jgi:hypothetical protein
MCSGCANTAIGATNPQQIAKTKPQLWTTRPSCCKVLIEKVTALQPIKASAID